MAKAGFWLRGAQGKLAGASMGKGADGQTIMREIVTPKNPRTNGQLYQRAIMATVMRAYGSGKAIFDHSFEGKSRGSQCQRYFLKRNARILRSIIADELDNAVPLDEQQGIAVGPGTNSPVGFEGMLVSEGNYTQRLFNISRPVDNPDEMLKFSLPAAATGVTTRADYAAQVGLIANDYYTICGFMTPFEQIVYRVNGVNSYGAKQYNGHFFFIRLRVKDSFVADTAALAGTTMADIFEVDTISERVNPAAFLALAYNANIEVINSFFEWGEDEDKICGWAGIIRSRLDEDLRSTSYLYRTELDTFEGIATQYILDAWKQGTEQVGDSSLILEGGDF